MEFFETVLLPKGGVLMVGDKEPAFSTEEYAQRRSTLAKEVEDTTAVVIPGRIHTGAFDVFRQNNEFYYLCGIEVPQAYLVITGGTGQTTVYLPAQDEKMERSEGVSFHSDDPETVSRETGIEQVRNYGDLARDLQGTEIIYLPCLPGEGKQMCRDTLGHGSKVHGTDPWDGHLSREERFAAELSRQLPGVELRDIVPLLDRLRGVKSTAEIDAIRAASLLTAMAVREGMKATGPGMKEYQLAAVAEYVFRVNGARGGAYRPIVAAGKNIWNAHYYRNNCPLLDGDLVLMDYAPDYCYYTSDIGRIWPVNGKYNSWQKELYGFIVRYHQVLLSLIRPGVMAEVIEDEAADIMRPLVEKTDWSKSSYQKAARETLDFRGHLSHGVGMAVHDVWNYRQEVLKPGLVFAVDPQMWVRDEQLYIRVEDTVVVTEDGIENLTEKAPLELHEVEQLMEQAGMPEMFPPTI